MVCNLSLDYSKENYVVQSANVLVMLNANHTMHLPDRNPKGYRAALNIVFINVSRFYLTVARVRFLPDNFLFLSYQDANPHCWHTVAPIRLA
jgi:hypothetical protein